MKAIGVDDRIIYLDPSKAIVVLYMEKMYSEYFDFMQCNQYDFTDDLKYSDNQDHFIIL